MQLHQFKPHDMCSEHHKTGGGFCSSNIWGRRKHLQRESDPVKYKKQLLLWN